MLNSITYQTSRVKSCQKGATLIVCMVILVIVTILGVGNIQNVTLEEKMAANLKNRNMAFQAAETALRHAESYLDNTAVLPSFNGSQVGLYAQYTGTSTLPPNWSELTWSASGATYSAPSGYSDEIGGVAEAPKYVIEKLESVAESTNIEAGQAEDNDEFYRITTRAVGGVSSAVVILQSIYKR